MPHNPRSSNINLSFNIRKDAVFSITSQIISKSNKINPLIDCSTAKEQHLGQLQQRRIHQRYIYNLIGAQSITTSNDKRIRKIQGEGIDSRVKPRYYFRLARRWRTRSTGGHCVVRVSPRQNRGRLIIESLLN